MTGDDQEMKREMDDDIKELALKYARKAADIPLPDEADLFIEDAFIVEMQPGTMPKRVETH